MRNRLSGFTLIELLLTLAIAAILLTMAVPSMSAMISSSRVAGAADRIKSEIEWSRTEAVKDNQTVSVFLNTGADWCIGFDDNSDGDNACDCTANSCQVNGQTKVVNSNTFRDTSLADDVDGDNFNINARGLVDGQGNGLMSITDGSHTATLTLSLLGRATICSDNIPKYTPC